MKNQRVGNKTRAITTAVMVSALFLPCTAFTQTPDAEASRNPGGLATASNPHSPERRPLTREERGRWFLKATIGPTSLAAGVISSAWGTGFNRPEEYGTHWDGFAKRYGMRLTGVATSNAMEAGLGCFWGEDPRYPRLGQGSFKGRLGHAAKMTFLADRVEGHRAPAYARYAAISGNNFLSNTWRPDSSSTTGEAAQRVGLGFAARFAGNVWAEFWPSARRKLFGGK